MEIITAGVKNLHLDSKFVSFKSPKGEIVLDIVGLMRAEGDKAYFNATSIAKLFADTPRKATMLLQQYSRLQKTKDYKRALIAYHSKRKQSGHDRRGKSIESLKAYKPFVIERVRRGYTGDNAFKNGTWFHKDLALDFFRYLDADFAVACDQFLKQVITQVQITRVDRKKTKVLFHPLTDAIKDIYIPTLDSENAIKWAYTQILDMCNEWGLGITSKAYQSKHGIQPAYNESIRDYMNDDELERIKLAEKHIYSLLFYANVTNYHELKHRLFKL